MWVDSARVRCGCESRKPKPWSEEKEPLVAKEVKVGRLVMRRERAVARWSLDGVKSCEERNATETFVLEGVEGKNKARATAGEEVRPVRRVWDASRVGSVRVDGGRKEGDWWWGGILVWV